MINLCTTPEVSPVDSQDIDYLDDFIDSLTDEEIEELNQLSEETRDDPVSWDSVKAKLGL